MMQQQVIRAALDAWRKGVPGALGTIVAVEGSAYQREGASVYVAPGGGVLGLVSGGCLESEVAGEAADLPMAEPRILRYDTSDESIFGYGMGCPGIVDVLLEKLPSGDTPLGRFLDRFADGMPVARGVRLDLARQGVMRDIVYIPGHANFGSLGNAEIDAAFVGMAEEQLRGARAPLAVRLQDMPQDVEIFAWIVPAEAECVIFGATDDAQPLARLALELGFKVQVVDPRPHLASPDRFPHADVRCLALKDYSELSELGSQSYVVVMGHQVERDLAALTASLRAKVPYIGLLSSEGRRQSMLGHLRDLGVIGDEDPEVLHSPAGIRIGARTPEEIALSIVAEICSVRRSA